MEFQFDVPLSDFFSSIDIAFINICLSVHEVHIKHFYVGNILTGKIVENKFEGKNFKIKTQYFLRFIE